MDTRSTLLKLIKFPVDHLGRPYNRSLNYLINKQEGILAYKVINGTFLLNDFLNHEDVRHQIQLRNGGDLRIPLYGATQSPLFVPIEPSIRGMAFQVTCAADHRSVLSRINYDTCICLSHSF